MRSKKATPSIRKERQMKKHGASAFGLKDINAESYVSLLGLDPETLTSTPSIRSAVRSDVQSGGLHSLTYRAKKNKNAGYSVKVDHWVRYPDGTSKSTNVVRLKSVLDEKGRYTMTRSTLFGHKVFYRDEAHFFQFVSQLREILREIRYHHLPSLKTLIDLQKTFIPDKKHYLEGIDATGQASFHGKSAQNIKGNSFWNDGITSFVLIWCVARAVARHRRIRLRESRFFRRFPQQ